MTAVIAPVECVVMGGSWGGLEAACALLGQVPAPAPVPIVLVLHRSIASDGRLIGQLIHRRSRHVAVEAEDQVFLEPGVVHLSPADYHLLVQRGCLALSVEGPVNFSRPSLDVAFSSAADAYGSGLLAAVLSGASADGAAGLRAVARRGGRTVTQAPETAERPEMPSAALATGLVEFVGGPVTLGQHVAQLLTARPAGGA